MNKSVIRLMYGSLAFAGSVVIACYLRDNAYVQGYIDATDYFTNYVRLNRIFREYKGRFY